ncbi:MAG TPA: NAD-dependent epimerase/dehydratase family protein [Thermomicrobiaceae bacterium]|nr:NAD-dependent epimerase/dehydratase family protein [Thermomicrobiaceae bacterium]
MDIEGSRLMLIGGAGLIGSYIADRLVREPVDEVIVYDNFVRGRRDNLAEAVKSPKLRIVEASITDRDRLDRELEGIDGVFLLASLWLGECVTEPRSAWTVNTMGTWNVVETCLARGVKRIVYSSSASVYGNALEVPMTEDHPFNNRTTYGATKIANEQMFRAIYEQHKLPYVGMRYMNIYGPRMDYQGTYVSVIMKALDKILAGERPIIFGDGSQVYDFIYVDDAAEANVLAMKADCADECFNVGTGVGTSINDIIQRVLKFTRTDLTPEYRPQAQSYVTNRIGSTEKAERLLGFKASTPLDEGLGRVVEWRLGQRAIA